MVTWVDTISSDGWFDHKEITEFCREPPLTMETMGWLIFETEGWIVLAMSAGFYNMGDLFKIPRSAIISIEPVSFGGDHERV